MPISESWKTDELFCLLLSTPYFVVMSSRFCFSNYDFKWSSQKFICCNNVYIENAWTSLDFTRKRGREFILCHTLASSGRFHIFSSPVSLLHKQMQVKARKVKQKRFLCISLCAGLLFYNFVINKLSSFQMKVLHEKTGIKVIKQNWNYAKINYTDIPKCDNGSQCCQ